MTSALAPLAFLPQVLALLGLFLGRKLALMTGNCPHRGKVWGAFGLPLVTLLLAPESTQLLTLLVSAGAALGAGLTAHSTMAKTFGATCLAVLLATGLAVTLAG